MANISSPSSTGRWLEYYPDFYEFFKYLHDFKECVYAPSPLFIETWLNFFRTPSVDCVAKYENAIHDEHYGCFDESQAQSVDSEDPSHSNLLLLAIIIRIWERTLEIANSEYLTSCHNFYVSRCSSQATDVSPITKYLAHYEEASEIY